MPAPQTVTVTVKLTVNQTAWADEYGLAVAGYVPQSMAESVLSAAIRDDVTSYVTAALASMPVPIDVARSR